jgi:hypothetical protein
LVLAFQELKADTIALVLVDGDFEHLIFPVTPNQTGDNDASEETESSDEE